MAYYEQSVNAKRRIAKGKRATKDATDKYARRLSGSISTSVKHSLVRQVIARGLIGATGSLSEENAWHVQTDYKGGGRYEISFVNPFSPYAEYINRPGGPYGPVQEPLLREWMVKKYGCVSPVAVMGMKRRIETVGHFSQRGRGFMDAAIAETMSMMGIMAKGHVRSYADDIWANITSGAL